MGKVSGRRMYLLCEWGVCYYAERKCHPGAMLTVGGIVMCTPWKGVTAH